MILSKAIDKLYKFFVWTNLQKLRERATIGWRKIISCSTIACSCKRRASISTALCCSSSSLSRSSFSVSLTFFVSSLPVLKRNLPPAVAIGHLFHWIDEHPSHPWLFAFLAIPVVDLPFYHTPPRWETVLKLSLFFCKLSSTSCCFKSPSHLKWRMLTLVCRRKRWHIIYMSSLSSTD